MRRPGGSLPWRRHPARGLQPLRCKPKQLTEEPEPLDVSPSGGALFTPEDASPVTPAWREELASVPSKGGSDDIDLDRTVEQFAEHPVPEDEDIVVRERIRTRRRVVLVDVSGSMRDERCGPRRSRSAH